MRYPKFDEFDRATGKLGDDVAAVELRASDEASKPLPAAPPESGKAYFWINQNWLLLDFRVNFPVWNKKDKSVKILRNMSELTSDYTVIAPPRFATTFTGGKWQTDSAQIQQYKALKQKISNVTARVQNEIARLNVKYSLQLKISDGYAGASDKLLALSPQWNAATIKDELTALALLYRGLNELKKRIDL